LESLLAGRYKGADIQELCREFISEVSQELDRIPDLTTPEGSVAEREEDQPPVVKDVTIEWGDTSYWVQADTDRGLAIPLNLLSVVELFVKKIEARATKEPVSHRELESVVGRGVAQPGKASGGLRKAISKLNKLFDTLGRPAKKKWFRLMSRRGYYLNNFVTWKVAKGMASKRDGELWPEGTDQKIMEQITADRKLPAQPHRPRKRRDDE